VQFRLKRMGLIDPTLFADATESRLPMLTELDIDRSLVGGEVSR